ncbi:acetyl-CoA carboxylase biotin carboxyl carrier protein [bacterium]|nr:acetyl-CoA carboxylase biotin carboxyl carrier protein [bacterium]
MDIKEIKHFLKLMDAYGLCEFTLETADGKISLKRPQNGQASLPNVTMARALQDEEVLGRVESVPPAPAAPAPPAPSKASPAPKKEEDKGEGLIPINSPMVGTFYAAASPDSPPLVTEGQSVNEETVVAVIESMKIMSEIKAECRGVIEKICVGNGQPVEFGQTLFMVRPE